MLNLLYMKYLLCVNLLDVKWDLS